MGDKTSHRRKHLKERDPMALALEDPIFRQRRVEPKHKDRVYIPDEWEGEEND